MLYGCDQLRNVMCKTAMGEHRGQYRAKRHSSVRAPFLPPASTTMLQMVMRSSMVIASTTGPTNSMLRYVAPATLICAWLKAGVRARVRVRA